jgi:hypothetical protein
MAQHLSTANAAHQAHRVTRDAVASPWITALARAGYAAKGVVYLIIGWLTLLAAIGAGGRVTDTKGAILTIYDQPFGTVLLAIVVVGLCGFAVWSFVQAWLDTEGKGGTAGGIVARLGYVAVGVAYLILSFTALQLVLGAGHGGKSSDATTQGWTARLLTFPFGRVLVVLVGIVILGVALYMFYKAYSARFQRRLNLAGLSQAARKGVVMCGRCGYAAIGVVFVVIGVFMIIAGLRHNAHAAKGLAGALRELAHQPYGSPVLGIVALGLLIYGVYSLAEARYRRVGVAS